MPRCMCQPVTSYLKNAVNVAPVVGWRRGVLCDFESGSFVTVATHMLPDDPRSVKAGSTLAVVPQVVLAMEATAQSAGLKKLCAVKGPTQALPAGNVKAEHPAVKHNTLRFSEALFKPTRGCAGNILGDCVLRVCGSLSFAKTVKHECVSPRHFSRHPTRDLRARRQGSFVALEAFQKKSDPSGNCKAIMHTPARFSSNTCLTYVVQLAARIVVSPTSVFASFAPPLPHIYMFPDTTFLNICDMAAWHAPCYLCVGWGGGP